MDGDKLTRARRIKRQHAYWGQQQLRFTVAVPLFAQRHRRFDYAGPNVPVRRRAELLKQRGGAGRPPRSSTKLTRPGRRGVELQGLAPAPGRLKIPSLSTAGSGRSSRSPAGYWFDFNKYATMS